MVMDSENGLLQIMAIQDYQRIESEWFASSKGPTDLTRGVEGPAAIERLRLERLPGQLRLTKQYNIGDGEWALVAHLDDLVTED